MLYVLIPQLSNGVSDELGSGTFGGLVSSKFMDEDGVPSFVVGIDNGRGIIENSRVCK